MASCNLNKVHFLLILEYAQAQFVQETPVGVGYHPVGTYAKLRVRQDMHSVSTNQ